MARESVGGWLLQQVAEGTICPDCGARVGSSIFYCPVCATTWLPDLPLAEVEAWWISSGLLNKLVRAEQVARGIAAIGRGR